MWGFAEYLIDFLRVLINSIIQEYKCKILHVFIMTLESHLVRDFCIKTSFRQRKCDVFMDADT